MTYIETIPESEATGETAEICAGDRERMGCLPNYTKVFSARPALYRAWQALNGGLKESMDLRRYELATLAAARRLGSEYCALAHGAVLREQSSTRTRSQLSHATPVAPVSTRSTSRS
jgi:AhpD family alkylhydroperoxidase